MKRSVIITVVVGCLVLLVLAIANRPSASQGGAAGHAELLRIGRVHHGAWSGRPNPTEYLVAALHFKSPSEYYQQRYEEQLKLLKDSGYLAPLTIAVPDLRAKMFQVIAVLSNTSAQTGSYVQWTPDPRKDEVGLLCRTQDVGLWNKTLAPFSK